MYSLSSMVRPALLAMLLLASTSAIPQTAGTRYTVEIVVFRNSGQAGALPSTTAVAPDANDDIEMSVSTSRKLAGAASKLKASGVKVLAHTAWVQSPTGCANQACRTVVVRGVSAEQLGLTRAGIAGKVGLQRGTYLFLGLDLTIEEAGRRYRIQEVRQIKKTDEPQYFDHPAIGVLAVVTAAP